MAEAARDVVVTDDPGGTDAFLVLALLLAAAGSTWSAVGLARYGNGSDAMWFFVGLPAVLGLAFAAGAAALLVRSGRSAPEGAPGAAWYGPAGLGLLVLSGVLLATVELPNIVPMATMIGGFQLTAFDSRWMRQRRAAAA